MTQDFLSLLQQTIHAKFTQIQASADSVENKTTRVAEYLHGVVQQIEKYQDNHHLIIQRRKELAQSETDLKSMVENLANSLSNPAEQAQIQPSEPTEDTSPIRITLVQRHAEKLADPDCGPAYLHPDDRIYGHWLLELIYGDMIDNATEPLIDDGHAWIHWYRDQPQTRILCHRTYPDLAWKAWALVYILLDDRKATWRRDLFVLSMGGSGEKHGATIARIYQALIESPGLDKSCSRGQLLRDGLLAAIVHVRAESTDPTA